MFNVTVEPNFDQAPSETYIKPWKVMDDLLCYSRHDTKEDAEKAAEELRHNLTLGERVQELLDAACETIMEEFSLSETSAQRELQEYLSWMI